MQHYYSDVPGLGNIAFSRHAQERLEGVSDETIKKLLYSPTQPDRPDGKDIIRREGYGICLVILRRPTPYTGASLVKTAFKIQGQLRSRY